MKILDENFDRSAYQSALSASVGPNAVAEIERRNLLAAVEAATPKGFSTQAALKLGPMAYFAGVERDLAELCVGRR